MVEFDWSKYDSKWPKMVNGKDFGQSKMNQSRKSIVKIGRPKN